MATQTRVKTARMDLQKTHGLDGDALIRLYRVMYLSRKLDDREIQLKRQNKIYFQISSAGHEAVSAAAGLLLRPGVDWVYPYYRDRALCMMLGVTPLETLLQAVGAKDDPASGGRQMPSHWSSPALRILSGSSPTGTQFLHAAGCADGKRYVSPNSDEITLVCSGEGATSEGEFWECLNIACLERLPLLILVEDNGYAISVPVERQTAGGNIPEIDATFDISVEAAAGDIGQFQRGGTENADFFDATRQPVHVRHAFVQIFFLLGKTDGDDSVRQFCAVADANEFAVQLRLAAANCGPEFVGERIINDADQ